MIILNPHHSICHCQVSKVLKVCLATVSEYHPDSKIKCHRVPLSLSECSKIVLWCLHMVMAALKALDPAQSLTLAEPAVFVHWSFQVVKVNRAPYWILHWLTNKKRIFKLNIQTGSNCKHLDLLSANGTMLEQVKPSASNQSAFTGRITAVNVSISSARTVIKLKILLDLNFFWI